MHQQHERDVLEVIADWKSNPTGRQKITEGACLTMLQQIEERRKINPEPALDQAEAVVLTKLAAIRLMKKGGENLAAEWIKRALQLAPNDNQALNVQLQLYFTKLRESIQKDAYPAIRETDNVVTRRRKAEVLQQMATDELKAVANWRLLAKEARDIAQTLSQVEWKTKANDLEQLYMKREQLLQELLERVEAYSASLSGVFFSIEMLSQLQETIRALTEQQSRQEQLLSEQVTNRTDEAIAGELGALEKLEQLIGLEEIKNRVRQLAQFLQYRQLREERGWHMQDQLPLHLVLMGNPGTGKTTLARYIASLYHELGLLSTGQLVEVDRSHLVGAYVGQTEQRVMDAVKQADGGVLFIDEAYSLKRPDSSGSDYGQAAIDTLVAAMTSGEYAGRFVVMLAGYPEEMRHFLFANPGLYSRFPQTGHFLLPNYTTDELIQIADEVATRNDFALTDAAKKALRQRIEKAQVDDTFGNARTVTNLVLDSIFAKGRASAGKELQWEDFTLLLPEDVTEEQVSTDNQSALDKLQCLIGLAEVKAELRKIAAFVAVAKERNVRGMTTSPIELHAVFTGNPGTGKTTVAQLYAQILKEIGYLKRGHLVTASRADLVAGYVGQTATHTRRKVREALGGVLFIDEAYALLGSGENDFGQEAIHTLVEEMTRHEENLVIVLAGYPTEMNQLLASNPGLLSRFKKYVHFPDYSVDELVWMLQQAAHSSGYSLVDSTVDQIREKLLEITSKHRVDGNGRFSNNLLQEAIQNQALRLMTLPKDEWTQERLSGLIWEDFSTLLDVGEI
ncbi:AAA family ATPase [Brevibacillus sp. SIMBA_040]|uniref:AAA family ATPase n=1 Tax=unclassified Brevibacillus TaxID=2684853 RepID=UPI00397850CA